MTCHVTGAAMRPDGGAYASATFSFTRLPSAVVSQAGAVVSPTTLTVTTDAGGLVDFTILPGNYQAVEAATGRKFSFAVPDDASADFADCVDAAAIVDWPDAVKTTSDARDEVVATYGAISVSAPGAPALIQSAQSQRADGVSLKKVVGSGYSESQDAGAIINAVSADIFGGGLRVVDDHGLILSAKSQILLRSSTDLDLRKSLVYRDFTGPADQDNPGKMIGGNAYALFSTPDFNTTDLQGVRIVGGTYRKRTSDLSGTFFYAFVHDLYLEGLNIEGYSAGRAIHFGGDRGRIVRVRAISDDDGTGDGFCRFIGGTGLTVYGCYAECGDDLLQCVPGSNRSSDDPLVPNTNPRFGLSISQVSYIANRGISRHARFMIAAVGYPTATPKPWKSPGTIQNVSYIGNSGRAPGGIVVDGAACAAARAVDNINFDGCHVYANSASEDPDSTGGRITGSADVIGTVGTVNFTDSSLRATFSAIGLDITAKGANVELDNMTIEGQQNALRIKGAGSYTTIRGGVYSVISGGATDRQPILSNTVATNSRLVVDGAQVIGMPSNTPGITVSGSGSVADIRGLYTQKASGATGVKSVSAASGTTLFVNEEAIFGDHDDLSHGAGNVYPRIVNQSKLPFGYIALNDVTNGSRDVTQLANLVIEDSAPPADRTHSISVTNATKGDRIRWYRNSTSAGKIIVSINGGATLGTLANIGDWIEILFNGSTWTVIDSYIAPTTVAGLVAGAPINSRTVVTDANSTTFASIVAGGGSNKVPVYSDGTNWKIG